MWVNSNCALKGKEKEEKPKPNPKITAKELHVTHEPAGKALWLSHTASLLFWGVFFLAKGIQC